MLSAVRSHCPDPKRVFGVVTVTALCTLVLYVTYRTKDSEFLRGFVPAHSDLCPCPVAPENRSLTPARLAPTRQAPPTRTGAPSASDSIVLLWFWPFGVKFELKPCTVYNISGCHVTDDRSLYGRAHAVLVHHRDINGDASNLPGEPRPWFQKWVWWNMESPTFSYRNPRINKLFNVTCGYRQDAVVPVPYGYLARREEENRFQLPSKDNLVCWVVSHWSSGLKRIHVYVELSKFINVSVYGRHFNKPLNRTQYKETMRGCKFYLSFENSLHRDYMSGKLWDAMELGAVPVVMGPPRENYEEMVPGDSFLHIDDYPSMRDLARHLTYLGGNATAYGLYFQWTRRFEVRQTSFGLEHACRSCDYVRRNRAYQVVNNLNRWYWG